MAENPFTIISDRLDLIEDLLQQIKANVLSPKENPSNDIGSVTFAREVTGLSCHTIYKHASNRNIPHFKKGGKLYFSRKALLEWIREGNRKCKSN